MVYILPPHDWSEIDDTITSLAGLPSDILWIALRDDPMPFRLIHATGMYVYGVGGPHYPAPAVYDDYSNPSAWVLDWLLNSWRARRAEWKQKYIW